MTIVWSFFSGINRIRLGSPSPARLLMEVKVSLCMFPNLGNWRDRPGNRSRSEDEHPEISWVSNIRRVGVFNSNIFQCFSMFFFPFPLVEIQYWQNYWNTLRFHKKKEVRHWTVLKNIPKITSGGWSASGLATPTCWCVNLYQQPPKKRKEPLFLSYVLYIYYICIYICNIYIYINTMIF